MTEIGHIIVETQFRKIHYANANSLKITKGNSLILLNIKKKHLGIFDKYSDVVEELAVYAPGEWILAYKSGQEIL